MTTKRCVVPFLGLRFSRSRYEFISDTRAYLSDMASAFLRDFLRYIRNGELSVEKKKEMRRRETIRDTRVAWLRFERKPFHDGGNHFLISRTGQNESRT